MVSNQQRRDAARRKLQRQNERRARQESAMKTKLAIVGVIGAIVVIAGISFLVGNRNPPEQAADTATCSYPTSGTSAKEAAAPTDLNPADTGSAAVTLHLNSGAVQLSLDRAAAPCTVNSFLSLAEQGYFDGSQCHRLTTYDTLKVLQCGDPSATGAGGPGYSFSDELTGDETYPAGTVAMANSGADTNGSQFFLVYADSDLPPEYTVFGHITDGLPVLEAIAEAGVADGTDDGAPADPVTIDSITL